MGRGPKSTRDSIMKRHIVLVTASLAGALAIAMSVEAGPLGVISGGAGGGAMGALGGTLSGAGQNFGMGSTGALGAGGQFQGQMMQPDPSTGRAPLRSATGAVQWTRDKAESKAGAVRDTAQSTSGFAAGETQEAVSATAANAHIAGQASASASGRENASGRRPRNVHAFGSAHAKGEASVDSRSGGSAQTEAALQR